MLLQRSQPCHTFDTTQEAQWPLVRLYQLPTPFLKPKGNIIHRKQHLIQTRVKIPLLTTSFFLFVCFLSYT